MHLNTAVLSRKIVH